MQMEISPPLVFSSHPYVVQWFSEPCGHLICAGILSKSVGFLVGELQPLSEANQALN